MNDSQRNAVSLCNSPWVMDPITYQLALQVLNDAINHYDLEQSDLIKTNAAIEQLEKLYKHALANYQPLQRLSHPEL